MNKSTLDEGVIEALLERLEKHRLPRLLALKKKVDGNERLSGLDLDFLGKAMADATSILPKVEAHPEYESLATKIVSLYKEITDKALELEKR